MVRKISEAPETSRNYTIRLCRTSRELASLAPLQKKIWGYRDLEVYPLRLFVNLTRIGGHVLGAFSPQDEQVGFVASLPAWRGRRLYFHSLSLGVLPQHENRGVGRALKLEQRKQALASGIEWIEWSFDPLRAKNAFFNIERLGAVCRRYYPDYYGPVASRFQQSLPTDRLIAEWWLESPRVRRALAGEPARSSKKKPAAQVAFPADFGRLAENDPARAVSEQRALREKLQDCFARELVVTGLVKGGEAARYLLDRHED